MEPTVQKSRDLRVRNIITVLRIRLVTVPEGENTGVEVTCKPISNHIYKYVMLVGRARDDTSREEFDELMGDCEAVSIFENFK